MTESGDVAASAGNGTGLGVLRALLVRWGGKRFAAVGVWAFFCFALELLHFRWTIDEELVAFASRPNLQWVAQGRWAMYVWNAILFPDGLTPLLPQAVALAFLVTGAALLAAWLAPEGRVAPLAVAFLFVAHPVHALLLAFSTAQYGLFLGLLLAIAGAILLAETRGGSSLAVATAFLTLAVATYQPDLLVAAALLVAWSATRLVDASRAAGDVRRELFGVAGRALAAFAGAVVLYKLVDVAANAIARTPSQYHDAGVGALLHAGDLPARLQWTRRALEVYYASGVRLDDRFVLAAYAALFAAALLLLATRHVGALRRLAAAIALFALAAVPFALEFVFAAALPERSHVALPVAIALVAALALRAASPRVRRVVLVGLAALAFRMAILDNKLALAQELSERSDREEVRRIQSAVEALDGLDALPRPVPLTFVGALRGPDDSLHRRVDVVGGSFLAWDGGNPWRIDAFMKTMGIEGYRSIDRASWQALVERVRGDAMPSWPARGSVRIVEGIVVVKLGEP